MKTTTIIFRNSEEIEKKLKKIKEIYKIKTNTDIIELLIEAEMRRQGF